MLISDQNYTRWSSYIVVFSIIDQLFIPRVYFSLLLPISLIFAIILTTIRYNKIKIGVSIFFLLIMLLSAFIGYIYFGYNNLIINIQRSLQLFSILLYFQLKLDFSLVQSILLKVIRFFFIWLLVMIFLFITLPEVYFNFTSYFYPETLEYAIWNIQTYRFAYIFSDPNSAAYLISIISFLNIKIEHNPYFLTFSFLISAVAVFMTQSRGGLICIAIILIYFILTNFSFKKVFLIIIVLFILFFSVWYVLGDFISEFYKISIDRINSEDGDIGGGRISKYFYFIKNINFYPLGVGYTLQRNGLEFRPHSDLIRLNLSYGILSIPLFFYLFPSKSRTQITLILILIIPFLINSLIDDFRLLGIAILASTVVSEIDKISIKY